MVENMRTPTEGFRVIIAGASVGGLTLANALQRAGIAYILLEKRDLCPDLGASIALLPSTMKVLEQLGVAVSIYETVTPVRIEENYDERARLLRESNSFELLLQATKRPVAFMMRQFLLKQLYEALPDKENIRGRCGVESFVEDEDGVTVTTDTGEQIRGSILVGADGIHSTVRKGMAEAWIQEGQPEAAKEMFSGFTSHFSTLFGISRSSSPPLALGHVHSTHHPGPHIGFLTVHTVNDLIFWFVWVPLDRAYSNDHSPRYTEANAEALVGRLGNLTPGPGYTLRDLWNQRLRGGMVPQEEGVLRSPWRSPGGRAVLLGDAAHKTTIIAGLGGNMVVSGVCHLVNELVPVLKREKEPSGEALRGAWARYQEKQTPRAEHATKSSSFLTRVATSQTWWMVLFWRYVIPWLPSWVKAKSLRGFDGGAPILEFLPEPGQGKGESGEYHDE